MHIWTTKSGQFIVIEHKNAFRLCKPIISTVERSNILFANFTVGLADLDVQHGLEFIRLITLRKFVRLNVDVHNNSTSVTCKIQLAQELRPVNQFFLMRSSLTSMGMRRRSIADSGGLKIHNQFYKKSFHPAKPVDNPKQSCLWQFIDWWRHWTILFKKCTGKCPYRQRRTFSQHDY